MGPGRNSFEKTEREKLGKFHSEEKERDGNIRRCITEQNFKIKFQFKCGTGPDWNTVKKLNVTEDILIHFADFEKIKKFQLVSFQFVKYLNVRPISGVVNRHLR